MDEDSFKRPVANCTILIPSSLEDVVFKHLKVVGTSLEVQRLRLRLPMQGMWVHSLARELRFHMPWG